MAKDNETIINEIEMAEDICFATLAQLAKSNNISLDDTSKVLDMARSLVDLCLQKANRSGTLNKPEDKKPEQKGDNPVSCKSVKKGIEAVGHMFNAMAMMEIFLAKQENRDVNDRLLNKMARRIAVAVLKDEKGINTRGITVKTNKDDDGSYSVEIIMPKADKQK